MTRIALSIVLLGSLARPPVAQADDWGDGPQLGGRVYAPAVLGGLRVPGDPNAEALQVAPGFGFRGGLGWGIAKGFTVKLLVGMGVNVVRRGNLPDGSYARLARYEGGLGVRQRLDLGGPVEPFVHVGGLFQVFQRPIPNGDGEAELDPTGSALFGGGILWKAEPWLGLEVGGNAMVVLPGLAFADTTVFVEAFVGVVVPLR
ncbi:MAG: hypothetical protein ACFCGT_18475 [Sandaracinaceae bacterium]